MLKVFAGTVVWGKLRGIKLIRKNKSENIITNVELQLGEAVLSIRYLCDDLNNYKRNKREK